MLTFYVSEIVSLFQTSIEFPHYFTVFESNEPHLSFFNSTIGAYLFCKFERTKK